MNIIRIFIISISCIAFLSGSAYANSLYKTGDTYISLGANKLSTSDYIRGRIKAGYFFIENMDINISYLYSPEIAQQSPLGRFSSTYNEIDLMTGYHLPISATIGTYASLGYTSGTGSLNLNNTPILTISNSGLVYEAGFETKINSNILAYISYIGTSVAVSANGGGTVNGTSSSYEAGIQYIF